MLVRLISIPIDLIFFWLVSINIFISDYETTNNNNHVNNNNYSSCNNSATVGDRRNESINMRQQVIHQEGHVPPSSRNGRNVDTNTHSRITNGNQNGNNRFAGSFDCTDEAQAKKSSLNGKNVITSSFYQPTKTQIISGNTPTLERVTQIHTSHIQHANNNSLHASKGKTYVFSIVRMIPVKTNKSFIIFCSFIQLFHSKLYCFHLSKTQYLKIT